MDPIVSWVIKAIVVGVLLWLLEAKVTIIDGTVKQVIIIVVIVAFVLWSLRFFGLL